ncbi:MAG: acyl-CoA/acyl-ACP dehydrogenase [Rhodospirillaceae bacterium]|nr:acyl-CoA/acyl-ACP dehydrogenase [Rhodospirillaceae bacterium]MBT6205454.1 acyl-CoA/acyl-ACP dehydrogenase [Rhodospirillaceae bacterium]
MDMGLTKDDLDVRARAREFREKFLFPNEEELDEHDHLPEATESQIRQGVLDYRLNAINHAREFGGQAMTMVQQCIVNEEVGAATNALWGRVWQPPVCLQDGTPEQIEKYLIPACRGELRTSFCTSEPTAGSDAGGVKTAAVIDGNHYVINGEKCFASNAEFADLNLLTTIVDSDPTKPTLFLIDKGTAGFNVRCLPRFAQRSGHGHPELDIEDMRVPTTQILGEVGKGYELTKDWFVEARLAIAARSIGMAIRATELALEWAREREQFGQAIINFQAVEFMIAEMATDIMAGKSMLYRVAQEIDSDLDRKTAHAKASAIKLFCSEAGFRVVDKAVQIFGGRGTMCENPVERLTRDVRLERIWEGTSEIQKMVMGGQIRKRGLDMYTGWD